MGTVRKNTRKSKWELSWYTNRPETSLKQRRLPSFCQKERKTDRNNINKRQNIAQLTRTVLIHEETWNKSETKMTASILSINNRQNLIQVIGTVLIHKRTWNKSETKMTESVLSDNNWQNLVQIVRTVLLHGQTWNKSETNMTTRFVRQQQLTKPSTANEDCLATRTDQLLVRTVLIHEQTNS